MKFVLILFLVGLASSASLYDAADKAADELIDDFLADFEKDVLDFDAVYAADEGEDEDPKTELGKKLKEAMDNLLEKMREHIDAGKQIKDDYIEKFKDLKKKLEDLKVDIGSKAREFVKNLREKIKDKLKDAKDIAREYWEKLKDIFNTEGQRSLHEEEVQVALRSKKSIREFFEKIKKAILEKLDKDKIKEMIEKLFDKGSEIADILREKLKEKGEKGKKSVLDFIDKFLEDKEEKELEERSLQEMFDKLKEYLKNFKIDLKEKYLKFGQWIKDVIGKGLDATKERVENLKKIAQEVIDHSKDMGRDVAAEGLEFLRPYKEDLGELWDKVKESVKELFNKKD